MGFANFVPNPQQGSFLHLLTQPMQQGAYMHPMHPVMQAAMQPTTQEPATEQPATEESPSQFNRNAHRLRDEPTSSDEAELVPETQPISPPQSQPKSKKGKKPAKEAGKDKPAGKQPCVKWTLTEEEELSKAWAETSEDPCTCNYQKRASFWRRVKIAFDKRMKYDWDVRSVDACSSKVKMLLSTVALFACVYNNTSTNRKSGWGDDDVLKTAQTRYRNTCPKFIPVDFMTPADIHAPRPKRSKTFETDSPGSSDARTHYFNVDNDDDTEASERPRPLGRNAARRAGSSSTAVRRPITWRRCWNN
ncbi:LOW QUALITY PROTEIN: hypothetical protein OSB04_007578 [Centaurea solstitialis]|uniref:Uncharacterized protein n=1 Tax=Centaurea solstitialis TaxID=347529 RepID=A0AA38U4N9_9ASTR|nr:LOW QUALITY PROTEIN: hypothetical protein OSB04_007578 [Centaurea solstitialis]